MDPLVPTNPAKRPAEVDRRLTSLERGMMSASNGAAAAINYSGGNPSVLAPGSFAPLFSPGPVVAFMVPLSGKVLVTMCMQSDITLPVSATNVMGRNEAGVALSGDYNTRAIVATETLYHARSGAPASVQAYEGVGVSRTILIDGLNPGPTTFTMQFRADKIGAVFPYVGGILLSVSAS